MDETYLCLSSRIKIDLPQLLPIKFKLNSSPFINKRGFHFILSIKIRSTEELAVNIVNIFALSDVEPTPIAYLRVDEATSYALFDEISWDLAVDM